jgi:hypothetical protein
MAHFGDFFETISQPGSDGAFFNTFGTTANQLYLDGIQDMSSLSAEGEEIVQFVRYRLGEPIVNVELANEQIYTAFEEANMAYSYIININLAESWFSDLLGLKVNYTQSDVQNRLPQPSLDSIIKMAGQYGEYSTPYAGNNTLKRAFIRLEIGKQRYDLYNESRYIPFGTIPSDVTDDECQTLLQYLVSISATNISFKNFHYYRQNIYGRAVDPYSAYMWLDSYQSGTNNFVTAMYLQPIWQDILRMTMLKTSDQVRKADVFWQINGRELFITPMPKDSRRIYFEFLPDVGYNYSFSPPWVDSLSGESLASWQEEEAVAKYVTGLQNIPFKDIKYSDLNSMSRYWIRMYTLALCKEMLGRVRSKFGSSIETPGGTLSLDGSDLISQGAEQQKDLKDALKTDLDKFTIGSMLEKEAKKAEDLNKQLQYVPLGMYRF